MKEKLGWIATKLIEKICLSITTGHRRSDSLDSELRNLNVIGENSVRKRDLVKALVSLAEAEFLRQNGSAGPVQNPELIRAE
jgi:hypothetical protein